MKKNNASTHVLVVDDIIDNIDLLTFELEDDGFIVETALSGQACLDKTSLHPPDIILLDIRMPGISGIETLSTLKEQPTTADIPVIMVSANNEGENVVQALDLGAHDFVSKPIEYKILSARMRSALRLSQAQTELEELNKELHRLASTDSLTNSFNRRYFFILANSEYMRAKRHSRSLTAIMIDIDHFKSINDNHGHAIGDEVLKILTIHCKQMLRTSDIFGRLGGEEFAICCPETNLAGALTIAEKIRTSFNEKKMEIEGKTITATLSLGIADFKESDDKFDRILRRADLALYEAKNGGRDKSCINT